MSQRIEGSKVAVSIDSVVRLGDISFESFAPHLPPVEVQELKPAVGVQLFGPAQFSVEIMPSDRDAVRRFFAFIDSIVRPAHYTVLSAGACRGKGFEAWTKKGARRRLRRMLREHPELYEISAADLSKAGAHHDDPFVFCLDLVIAERARRAR